MAKKPKKSKEEDSLSIDGESSPATTPEADQAAPAQGK